MINGLQIVNAMPLFNIKSPGNVNAFNNYVSEISNLQIIDTSALYFPQIYIPEMDSLSVNY